METMYQGKIVPDLADKSKPLTCYNSMCHGVRCEDCINFPLGIAMDIKYEYIQEGTKGVPDDRDRATSTDMD